MGGLAYRILLPTQLPATPTGSPILLERRLYRDSGGKQYPLPIADRIAGKPAGRERLAKNCLAKVLHQYLNRPLAADLIRATSIE